MNKRKGGITCIFHLNQSARIRYLEITEGTLQSLTSLTSTQNSNSDISLHETSESDESPIENASDISSTEDTYTASIETEDTDASSTADCVTEDTTKFKDIPDSDIASLRCDLQEIRSLVFGDCADMEELIALRDGILLGYRIEKICTVLIKPGMWLFNAKVSEY